jgi:hypothetical protein
MFIGCLVYKLAGDKIVGTSGIGGGGGIKFTLSNAFVVDAGTKEILFKTEEAFKPCATLSVVDPGNFSR